MTEYPFLDLISLFCDIYIQICSNQNSYIDHISHFTPLSHQNIFRSKYLDQKLNAYSAINNNIDTNRNGTYILLHSTSQNKDISWQQSPYRHAIMEEINNIFFLGQMIWDCHVYIVNKVSFTIYVCIRFACVYICLWSDKSRFAWVFACVHLTKYVYAYLTKARGTVFNKSNEYQCEIWAL